MHLHCSEKECFSSMKMSTLAFMMKTTALDHWTRNWNNFLNICYSLQMRPYFHFHWPFAPRLTVKQRSKQKTSHFATAHHPHPHWCYLTCSSELIADIQKIIRYSHSAWKTRQKIFSEPFSVILSSKNPLFRKSVITKSFLIFRWSAHLKVTFLQTKKDLVI